MKIQIQKLSALASKSLSFLLDQSAPENQVKRQIGLNIGRSSLTACEVSFNGEQLILERVIHKELIKNKPLENQIKDLVQEAKFESKQVNASLKGQGIVVRFLSFPKMNRADFASSIQFEAEKYLPFTISEVVIDYHIFESPTVGGGESADTMQVILVAARKTDVNKLIELAQAAELKLKAVDLDLSALVNAFEHSNPELKGRSLALIDFGAVDSTLAILEKGRLAFSRDIAFGGHDLAEILRRKLNISEEEAFKIEHGPQAAHADQLIVIQESLERLLHEVKSSFNYYYNQNQNASAVETVYVSGGFSQLSMLKEALEKQIELPVKTWDPTSQLTIKDTVDKEALKALIPYLPVSIGLAIRP
ncbi:MAG: type IV pilus assembly protein PilM [Candidatus Omnitrophica bacterium]|nr:type IV pilus assembly protein PilM [Candidatus Omnitrophota bacterium]